MKAGARVYHSSTRVSLRYLSWPWVAGLLALLSLVLHGPLLPQFSSAVPSDLGDPLLNTWILWWNAQRLPLTEAYWNAPAFAPAPNAFALSETLLGLTWLTTPLQWLGASPLVAYNAMFVLEPVLNGLSAYWLCITLTGRRDAALVGALAFAFAPYHVAQLSHLQTQATFFMPVALVGLHRYWASGSWRWLLLFSAAMILNALVCGYFLLFFSVLLGLAIAWMTIHSRDFRKLGAVLAVFVIAMMVLSPVILRYRTVQREWNLHRTIVEVEGFSADLSSIALGSPHLALWPNPTPVHRPEMAGYPGIVIGALLVAAAIIAVRDRRAPPSISRWQDLLVRVLSFLSLSVLMVGIVAFSMGGVTYKVFGIALDLGLLAALLSSRFTAWVRSGSPSALYTTGAIVASILALGPVGRAFGHRFWYKPPFAWLMTLPGFDSARVPALFSSVEIICFSTLAAFAVSRIWPSPTRSSLWAIAGVSLAIVLDGWVTLPVVPAPKPLPVPVAADLVVELPTRGFAEDVAAMYRGMTHGRPVVNGYSGWLPPHYAQLQADLRADCVKSLEGLRGGRSMDAVIWRGDSSAAVIDAGLKAMWSGATREETADVIVYRQPRTPPETDQKKMRCHATRTTTHVERP